MGGTKIFLAVNMARREKGKQLCNKTGFWKKSGTGVKGK